jgi:hypothetical protein
MLSGSWYSINSNHTFTLIYPDGRLHYEGELINGKRNGSGCEYYLSGTVMYKGQWKDNKRHGKGILFSTSGEVLYNGMWEKGLFANKQSFPEIYTFNKSQLERHKIMYYSIKDNIIRLENGGYFSLIGLKVDDIKPEKEKEFNTFIQLKLLNKCIFIKREGDKKNEGDCGLVFLDDSTLMNTLLITKGFGRIFLENVNLKDINIFLKAQIEY